MDTNSLRYYWDLTLHLAHRDFVLRYKGSVLGALWLLVIPLMQLLTLVFVFKKIIPLNIDAYPAFVFTGLLPWTWFSNCLSGAGALFVTNRDLIRRPQFPPFILATVNTLTNLLVYILILPLLIVTLLAYGHKLSWTVVYFPILVLAESILIIGLSLLIATWNVFYRDVQQIVGVLLALLFWITPVFYKSHAVDQKYQYVFDYNPIAIIITSFRDILFYSQGPEWGPLFVSVLFSIAVGVIGYVIYSRQLSNVIDTL